MRFLANGPKIPDDLLEARDRGEVVFLCGAGVSIPAGMPTFLGLANSVVDRLGASPDSTLRQLLSFWDRKEIPDAARPPLDQIFNLLQQEYDGSEVDYYIAQQLKADPGAYVSQHQTILRLSTGVDGNRQVVTTNFDHLFELAVSNLRTYAPSALPNLSSDERLDGLVYLHGRIDLSSNPGEARQDLIVSSSDFGRAYLAEGWATRFVRDLLDQYIVVLLGYRADDPPMRYLLQGLHSMGHGSQEKIYAFASGSEAEVQATWRDRGVEAIAYPTWAGDHASLWDTLEAWAQRADDPLAWQQRVVELAQKGPRKVEKHERGQVTSLVRTIDGAKLFAEADPPPPGEWLCVFDNTVRHGNVERDPHGLQPSFDPLIEYGLDDDPPRPAGNESEQRPPSDDLLSQGPTDSNNGISVKLTEVPPQENVSLPDRLSYLASWIGRVAHEPVVPWWAAKHTRLHPQILSWIERRLRLSDHDFPPLARSVWKLLLEKLRISPNGDSLFSFFRVEQLIAVEGWTNNVLEVFERYVSPYLTIESFPGRNFGRPPGNDWTELRLSDIAEFAIGFPYITDIESGIPEKVLHTVYRIGRRQLGMAVRLSADINPSFRSRLKMFQINNMGKMGDSYPGVYLQWFRNLLNRMVETHPDLVRSDMSLWPEEEPYFFHGLRLYAWSFDLLFTGEEVGDGLLGLSDKTFWDGSHIQKLKHLLVDRWQEFGTEQRKRIEERIVNGRERYVWEADEVFEHRKLNQSARILGWLASKGCNLGSDAEATLDSFSEIYPDWSPELEEAADDDEAKEGRFVTINPDPTVLLDSPLSQVIPLAREHTTFSFSEHTDFEPFKGLVKQWPDRALDSLTFQAQKDEYPLKFWKSALVEWPDEASPRATWLFGAVLAGLPSSAVFDLRFELFRWLEEHLSKLAMEDQERVLSILDTVLDKLFESGEDATNSGIGDVSVAGDSHGWSRKIFFHAINGPVGKAVGMLLELSGSQNPEEGSGIPSEYELRLKRLLRAPGEGADHAICVISERLEWLHYLDPEWARITIVPWFDPRHPYSEAAWNGLLYGRSLRRPALFSLLRSHFLEVFERARTWKWNDEGLRVLHKFLVNGCLWREHDEVYLTFAEVRRVLQSTDDAGRSYAAIYLADLLENKNNQVSWHQFGKRFLEEAWPKEIRFQTEDTSLNLARLAGVTGDDFPEVVQAILPRLVPVYKDSGFLFRVIYRDGDGREFELATKFPEATVALVNKLVPDNPSARLSDLNNILERIAEAKPTLRQDWRWRRLRKIARRE